MPDLDDRSRFLVEVFREFVSPKETILEIGSGDGRNIRFLKEAGYEVEGIDKESGTAVEDVEPKEYDVVYTMSTLFLIKDDSVFEKIANMARRLIITIEGETTKGEVVGRNYREIFEPFGFKEIHAKDHVFNVYGVLRVMERT